MWAVAAPFVTLYRRSLGPTLAGRGGDEVEKHSAHQSIREHDPRSASLSAVVWQLQGSFFPALTLVPRPREEGERRAFDRLVYQHTNRSRRTEERGRGGKILLLIRTDRSRDSRPTVSEQRMGTEFALGAAAISR